MDAASRTLNQIPDHPVRVHFKLVDAAEGEHDNVKAADDKKRAFFLAAENPVSVADGILEVHFEYRVENEDDKLSADQEAELKARFGVKNKGDMRTLQMAAAILDAVDAMIAQGRAENKDVALLEELATLLKWPAPTETIPKRPLIAKYLNKYTARNTSDYFIHKDLGAFLCRELDFYIKNEIMQLDNIEDADAPRVESYLAKIKVFRRIARQVIDFLAQLENFQKKLWLKKKFVVQCDYCITLDRVPAEFYPEIFANEKQKAEWLRLGIPEELLKNPEQIANHPDDLVDTSTHWSPSAYLMVDTKFFSEDFKQRLLAEIPNLDEQTDGLLVHSENFQALRLLQERYREQVKCIYIDPPYNTGNDGFIYKDNYQHSSWMSCLAERINAGRSLLQNDGSQFSSIGDEEVDNLRELYKSLWPNCYKSTIIIRRGIKSVQAQFETIAALNRGYEFVLHHVKTPTTRFEKLMIPSSVDNQEDEESSTELIGSWNNHWRGTDRPTMRYELFGITPSTGQWRWSQERSLKAIDNYEHCCKQIGNGTPTQEQIDEWFSKQESSEKVDLLRLSDTGKPEHYIPPTNLKLASDIWSDIKPNGSKQLARLIPKSGFETPKSCDLVERIIDFVSYAENDYILDYFAGSGTTGHAVINLNREDGGKRKYILVEMGEHFNTMLKPRLEKVVFSKDWKDGKPEATSGNYSGISHCFKYLRLESYEDTLNNIDFQGGSAFEGISDYRLKYMLDVESRGSQSLLNLEAFANPFAYTLKVRKAGRDESENTAVDLLETFNYLIGLRVSSIQAVQSYNAEFERLPDSELPEDQHTRLTIKGRLRHSADGKWRFRCVRGVVPKNRQTPNDGATERVLVIWRNLTGNLEEDNAVLDEYFLREGLSTQDNEVDVIYVNGSNNLPNLKQPQDTWKVRLTEEDFLARMWEEDDHA